MPIPLTIELFKLMLKLPSLLSLLSHLFSVVIGRFYVISPSRDSFFFITTTNKSQFSTKALMYFMHESVVMNSFF